MPNPPEAAMPEERKARWAEMKISECRYYTGVTRPRCKAGVEYAAVRDPDRAPYWHYPCLDPRAHCPKYERG